MTTDSLHGSAVERSPDVWVTGSTPYPWPFDGRIDADDLALIIVLPSVSVSGIDADEAEAAMANLLGLAAAVREFGGAVFRVTTPAPNMRAAVVGGVPWTPPTTGVNEAGEAPLSCSGIDGFFGSQLETRLRRSGRTHLLLAGGPLETSVHSTMRTANDEGYECLLVEDACVALHPELRRNSLSMVEMSGGIFGAIGSTASVIAALSAA